MEKWTEAFLLHLQNKNFSPHTWQGYGEDLREFADFCARRKADVSRGFTPALIRSFLAELSEKHPARNTVLRKIAALRSFTHYLLEQGHITQDPFKLLPAPKRERLLPKFLTTDEADRLIDTAAEKGRYAARNRALFELIYSSGLRRSEALGLSWSNIDFENDKIFIGQKVLEVVRNGKMEQVVSDEMKTESSRRSFRMVPEVKEILLAHKERQELYRKQFRRAYSKKYLDMVCVNPLGELIKPSYITSHFPKLLKQYGMRDIRFHDLRHPYVKPTTKNKLFSKAEIPNYQ